MSTDKDQISRYASDILADPTCRLDVPYWKDFGIDLNAASQFSAKRLEDIGKIREGTLASVAVLRSTYYTFIVRYTGEVVLDVPISVSEEGLGKYKPVYPRDLVLSRINCCRGSIGVVQGFQDNAICTNEMHALEITCADVEPLYLKIILRHPYYQDLILSLSTGASLERKRFPVDELRTFEVPIPPPDMQRQLIAQVAAYDKMIEDERQEVERLRIARNQTLLDMLGIDLVYVPGDEGMYALSISGIGPDYRLDFEHNRPTYDQLIASLGEGRYPLMPLGSDQLITRKITSGATPPGGIYPREGIPFVQGGNIQDNGLDLARCRRISPEFHHSVKRSHLRGGEVLVTIAGTIGRSGVNTELTDGNTNQAVAVLRMNQERILPKYVSAFLNSAGGQVQFAKHKHQFGTPNINTTELGWLNIPVPPREVQKDIETMVNLRDQEIASAKQRHETGASERDRLVTLFLLGQEQYQASLQRLK